MKWRQTLNELGAMINEKVSSLSVYYDKSKIVNNWLGYEPASDEAIKKKETELKVELPESYKGFLKTSNGFKQISQFAGHLFPVEEIGYLKDKEPDLYKLYDLVNSVNELKDSEVSDEVYNEYCAIYDYVDFKIENLLESIVISKSVEGSILLLIPNTTSERECQVWVFTYRGHPATVEYRSFEHLIQQEYEYTLSQSKE